MPNYMSGNMPFYQPGNNYNWGFEYPFEDSPLGGFFLDEQQPEGAYTRWLANYGYGGFDNKSNVLRGLYGRAAAGYGAAQGSNPDLTWRNYLDTIDPNEMLLSMTPFQRGERSGAGRMRWAQRT